MMSLAAVTAIRDWLEATQWAPARLAREAGISASALSRILFDRDLETVLSAAACAKLRDALRPIGLSKGAKLSSRTVVDLLRAAGWSTAQLADTAGLRENTRAREVLLDTLGQVRSVGEAAALRIAHATRTAAEEGVVTAKPIPVEVLCPDLGSLLPQHTTT